MFLRALNDTQKKQFFDLATKAANANGVIETSEKALLESYADEMGIEVEFESDLLIDELLIKLHEISTPLELNQIMFELVGMMMSDLEYDEQEKEFIDKVAQEFEISKDKIDLMFDYVNEYCNLLQKINVLMFD